MRAKEGQCVRAVLSRGVLIADLDFFEQWCLQHLFDSPLMLPRAPNACAATLGHCGGARCGGASLH